MTSHYNFLNSYYTFMNDPENYNRFSIRDSGKKNVDNPLAYYFTNTFLHQKLSKSTKLMRMILQDQTFTATDTYAEIFNGFMAAIKGEVPYQIPEKDKDGNTIKVDKIGYEKEYDDDIVQTIGKCLDTIMRHRSLLYYGGQNSNKSKEIDGVFYNKDGSIDLTMGGSPENVIAKMQYLLYGNEKKGSIFSRLSILKNTLTARYTRLLAEGKPIPDYLQELCNEDGSIKNEMLNYITPLVRN